VHVDSDEVHVKPPQLAPNSTQRFSESVTLRLFVSPPAQPPRYLPGERWNGTGWDGAGSA